MDLVCLLLHVLRSILNLAFLLYEFCFWGLNKGLVVLYHCIVLIVVYIFKNQTYKTQVNN